MTLRRFTVLLLLLTTSAIAEGGALVTFHPKATVDRSVVILGDVAAIASGDAVVVQQLSAVIIGPAPAADRTSSFTFETVRSRLMAAGADRVFDSLTELIR